MQPLSTPQKDVTSAFSMYRQAVTGSQNNIKAFRTQWNSQEIQSIFEHGKQSLKANADLSASAQVPRYGWQQAMPARRKTGLPKKRRHSTIEDSSVPVEEGEIGSIIAGFRTKYPQIKVETKDKGHDITVRILNGCTRFIRTHGRIDTPRNGRNQTQVPYSCRPGSKRPGQTSCRVSGNNKSPNGHFAMFSVTTTDKRPAILVGEYCYIFFGGFNNCV